MAYVSSNAPKPFALFESLGNAIWRLFQPLTLVAEANARIAKIEKLSSKSDAELAEMGLKREDIARVVFRDISYI